MVLALLSLVHLPKDQWTPDDKKVIADAREYCMRTSSDG